jgi:hypothetical protein
VGGCQTNFQQFTTFAAIFDILSFGNSGVDNRAARQQLRKQRKSFPANETAFPGALCITHVAKGSPTPLIFFLPGVDFTNSVGQHFQPDFFCQIYIKQFY